VVGRYAGHSQLCLLDAGTKHGLDGIAEHSFDLGHANHRTVAAELSRQGRLGRIWRVQKSTVYRALRQLGPLGLVRTVGEESSRLGPVRSLYVVTPAGLEAARTAPLNARHHRVRAISA
jgi:Transcriptional regulator PadR-like family